MLHEEERERRGASERRQADELLTIEQSNGFDEKE
jgi:hypothetical protein